MRVVIASLLVVVGCGRGVSAPVEFLEEHYHPSASAPVHTVANPVAEINEIDGLRVQVVTAPNGKRYRLRWRSDSTSSGRPQAGDLSNGSQLPKKGPGFKHVGRYRYGTDETITYLRYAAWVVASIFPGTARVVVQDISRNGGGRLPPHRSHRTGRDADISWYVKGNKKLRNLKTLAKGDFDLPKTWTFIEALLRTGAVQYLFIDREIQGWLYEYAVRQEGWDPETLDTIFQHPNGGKRPIIRHVRGHRNHLHVRFVCPSDDQDCES